MPASVRATVDKCSGHSCFPPRIADQGSPNVFVNDLPVVRTSDHWAYHSCPLPPGHDSQSGNCSPNVFANDLPRSRVGDPILCGSVMANGSPNVFIN